MRNCFTHFVNMAISGTKCFHNVVWQHRKGVAGSLVITLLQISQRILSVIFLNWLRFDRVTAMSLVSLFLLEHRVYRAATRSPMPGHLV